MDALFVLYDSTCGFCCQCANWLRWQPTHVPLAVWPSDGLDATRTFPELIGAADELTVVADDGSIYREADAWLIVLWALKDHRVWATRLSSPLLRPLARNAFELLASQRHRLSQWLGMSPQALATNLRENFGAPDVPKCAGQSCDAQPPVTRCEQCARPIPAGREFCPHCLAASVTTAM